MIESQTGSCHFCGFGSLKIVPGYEKFHRVTSDCKPWPPGGGLGHCPQCHGAQAIMDAKWHADAKQIYSGYTPYFQGGGVEQSVFDKISGAAITRSQRLVQRLTTTAALPESGRLLDIGCGNGALLRAFGASFKQWTLAGHEVHEHLRPVVEGIAGVEKLYTCPLASVPGRFRLISLIHVLEHVPSPGDFLAQIWEKLEPGGLLLIQVPDCAQNPFTFLVADHASHFFLPVLQTVVARAGYKVEVGANDWVAKELTVVARKLETPRVPIDTNFPGAPEISVLKHTLEWLDALVSQARALAKSKPFGLFGTSIAATWLYGELAGEVDFFVDEDPSRQGEKCFGKPVYAPDKAPADGHVFISLPAPIAESIRRRLEQQAVKARFYAPLPF